LVNPIAYYTNAKRLLKYEPNNTKQLGLLSSLYIPPLQTFFFIIEMVSVGVITALTVAFLAFDAVNFAMKVVTGNGFANNQKKKI
jgi:hypothetical protein